MPAHGRRLGNGATAQHDRYGLVCPQGTVLFASRQCGVVGENRAHTRDDRVRLRPTGVDVGARLRPRDPHARAVGGRRATIEGLRPLHRDMGTAESLHLEPRRDQRVPRIRQDAVLDLDPGIAQRACAPEDTTPGRTPHRRRGPLRPR